MGTGEQKKTGVSIHFIDEGIDSGEIIVQKKYKVKNNDTFNSLVKRNYEIAGKAMLEALDILESGDYSLIPNDDECATYNTIPDLKHAWELATDPHRLTQTFIRRTSPNKKVSSLREKSQNKRYKTRPVE